MNRTGKRIVITGAGVVSALGSTPAELFENLAAGKSAIRMMNTWPVPVPAAPLPETPSGMERLSRTERRSMGRVAHLAAIAGLAAFRDSGLDELPSERTACVIGSTLGASRVFEETFETLLLGGGREEISPMNFFKCASHTAAFNTANVLHIGGPVYAPASACAAGLQSIGLAAGLLLSGEADFAVAGGADELSHMVAESFCRMEAYAHPSAGEMPENAARPFDRNRSGLVCGEGAATVLLEEYEHARKRGARIYAEIEAYATNRGTEQVTQSDSAAVERCFRLLANQAESFDGLGLISAHATGTRQGDRAEAEALRRMFGSTVPVASLKGQLGHTLGASGALELIASLEMMRRGVLLPSANLCEPDQECAGPDYIREIRERKFNRFIKDCFAFGGINAVMLCRSI